MSTDMSLSGAADNIPPSSMVAAGEDTVCDVGSVSFESDKVVCSWTVSNYDNWPVGVREVKSAKFMHCNSSTEWCMVLVKDRGSLYFYFELLSFQKDSAMKAKVKASLVSSNGKKYEVYSSEHASLNALGRTVWKSMSGYSDVENGFNNVWKFLGEVSVPYIKTEVYQSTALQRPRRSITTDLAALLESGQLSDMALYVDEEAIRVHRAVLSARSPVFAAMLRHDTQESRTGIVHVQDIQVDVMRELLRFIYTDSTPLLEKMADRLLVAADKYDLPQLKELCEVQVAKNLTVDNVVDTAIIALTHSCDVLKRSVISFMKCHLVPIMGSKGWAAAVRNHAEIVVEMSRLVAEEPVG